MLAPLQSFQRFLLVGHPNVGKSFFFNRLTGMSANTGNRPGVTIERQEGEIIGFHGKIVEDLPGIYYVESHYQACAIDQQVTLQRLTDLTSKDLLVNVIDPRSLRPQLHLTLQLIELRRPMILILSFTSDDSLAQSLQMALGIPVLLEEHFSQEALWNSIQATCGIVAHIPSHPEISLFFEKIERLGVLPPQHSKELTLSEPTWDFLKAHSQTLDKESILSTLRYQFIDNLIAAQGPSLQRNAPFNEALDRIALHRFLGLPLFLSIMFSIFWLTIVGGGVISEQLQGLMAFLAQDLFFLPPILRSAGIGIFLGVQTVLSFIGPLGILYTCLGLLEHSGYMQRAALVVDRLMQYLKLPGQSFVPIVVGLGCNVPAILSARTLSDPVDRLQTILMSPFMSCSARLAIFTVFAQAFFAAHAHYAIFGLYVLGFIIAVFTGLAIRFVFQGSESSPLIMQYVDYQIPEIKNILQATFVRLQDFTIKAIQWIIPAIFAIHLGIHYHWALPQSLFEPCMGLFAPMGLRVENWPAVLSLLSGLIAKEVLIGTLQGTYQSGGGQVLELTYYFPNAHAAMSYLIFVLLYFPCVSVTFAIAKETNLFWAVFSGIWSTSLAYCCAVLYYQWAQAQMSFLALLGLTSLCLIYLLLIIMIVKYQMKADTKHTIPFRLKVSTAY